ncbi:energy transducer TonB [Hyalangium sp.]|uniref:energy transducer TonB n=1 Tax=Hyalangium sp. TaxID=2028555 RepID=UPI0039C85F55
MVWFEGPGAVQASSPAAPPSAPRAVARTRLPSVAAAPRAQPAAEPTARLAGSGPEVAQRVEQAPASPTAASPSADSAQSGEPSAEAPVGASVAEAATRSSVEGAPGAESGLPHSESGAASSGGAVGSRSAAAPGNGGPGGPALGDLRGYARRLSSVVARQRRYPEVAVRLGMQGTAHVQLRLRRDGSLMEPPRLVTSSGQDVLDAEALRMVEAAAPFEPLPESASRTDAGFVIPVVFSLRPGN